MIKVMIADDDFYVREGLSNLLEWEKLGAELCYVASSGKQIMEQLKKETADLLILDIKMPYMTGIEIAKYVGENMPGTCIVLLSAYADFEYAQQAMSAGIREYILKPINQKKIEQLSNLVKEVARETEYTKMITKRMHEENFEELLNRIVCEKDYVLLESLLEVPEQYRKIDIYKTFCIQVLKQILMLTSAEKTDREKEIQYREFLISCSTVHEVKEYTFKQSVANIENESSKYNKNERLTQKIISYIENNYSDTDLNVQRVADQFGYAADHLTRLFKNQTGISLQEWIIDYRLKKAAEFLENSELTIAQIAKNCGYDQMQYFVRFFKKRNGITPTEFRQKVRKQ